MARVKVKFLAMAYLTDGVGVIDLDAQTVFEALDKIKERYHELRIKAFDADSGTLNTEFTLLLNGKSVSHYSEKLADGDEVIVLPTISGGTR